MELNRLLRVFRSRWPIVALIALVGFASAFGLTALASGEAEPEFEATIAIQFELEGEETVEDLEAKIDTERGIAAFAAQDLIPQIPGASIFSDKNSARLVFLARGPSSEEAVIRARDLVDRYLEADPSSGSDVSGKLAELEAQAVEIQGEIDALQPALSPEEQALKSQHDLLDLKIARVEEEISALTVASVGATSQERADNAQRIEELEAERTAMQEEKAALPPPPSTDLDAVGLLRFDSLNRILEFLKLEYQRYQMRTFGITGTGGTLQPASVRDLTPDPPNPIVNGAIGFLGGAGIALLALVLTTRARKEVWLPSDLPLPLLGLAPRRKTFDFPGPSWYDASEGGERKDAVQALRSAIEGALEGPGSSFAVLGDHVDSVECHTLAADIGAAFASAGQTVLLVDADYADRTQLREFSVGDPTLESFLRLPGASESLAARVAEILGAAIHIRPGLAVVPSGDPPASPADALAAAQFRSLLDQATRTFDLVIVVAGTAGSPSAGVISQRVGAALVAVSPGRTTVPRLESLTNELHTQRVRALGAVMVSGAEKMKGFAALPLPSWARSADVERPVRVEHADPISRLRFYPFPMEKGSNPSRDGSLRTLVGDLSEAIGRSDETTPTVTGDGQLAAELLEALSEMSPAAGGEAVAGYLVARVEDILTAVSGQENLSGDLVEVVLKDGYVPLTPVRGHRTIGEWLIDELRWELGEESGERVAAEFARILDTGYDDTATTLDWWLTDEFFPRHIERTKGEPEVWHLSSPAGNLHILAYGRRLNRERLDRVNHNVVQRCIDDLQRRVDDAQREDDFEEVERFEGALRDLYLFEVALRMLQVGNSEESRIHYPWRRHDQQPKGWAPVWAEGIRPNIAPLQRLGLLAHPVLDEDELVTTQTAV